MEVTKLKDMDGWPIVIGGRVRSETVFKSGKKAYRHGEVVSVKEEDKIVEIRLFKNLHVITVPADRVKVMKGKTRNSFEYEVIRERLKRMRSR